MDTKYLRAGVNGLSRVLDSEDAFGSHRGWFCGHWACAVIAAFYFCRDNPIEPGVDEAVTREVDRMIGMHDDIFNLDEIDTNEKTHDVEDIIDSLTRSIVRYIASGHNVIYTAYALKVLTENPELATPPVLNGIVALLDYFEYASRLHGVDPKEFFSDGKKLTPAYENENDMIDNVFATLQYAPRLSDRHRTLFDGHLMTHAHALVLLSRLGYGSVARSGYESHRVHMEENRNFELQILMERWPKKVTVDDYHPFSLAFWDRDFNENDNQWGAGHVFKYLYTFYELAPRIGSQYRTNVCERQLAYLT